MKKLDKAVKFVLIEDWYHEGGRETLEALASDRANEGCLVVGLNAEEGEGFLFLITCGAVRGVSAYNYLALRSER